MGVAGLGWQALERPEVLWIAHDEAAFTCQCD